jgi:glyceraldehyde-3-phosphate dehydrogenase (NADP+)
MDAPGEPIEVRNPFGDEVVGTVPQATEAAIESALSAAVEGARHMARLPAGERAAILERVADLVAAETDRLARTVAAEQGKTLVEATKEVGRVPPLLRLCAGEARRITGEVVPLDQSADGVDRLGMTLRVPVGAVVAIAPFNYPALLVAHKLGPAFAAGNAVILKPATATPLSGLRLVELFAEAGAHPGAMQCVTGSGGAVGRALCADERVRAVTFTGSKEAGNSILSSSGVKHFLLELGANCPMIVAADADLAQAVEATALGGYSNAGQACISAQRILVERDVYGDYLEALSERVGRIKAGDPFAEDSTIGPLINEAEAERVGSILDEAASSGARVIQGGDRDGALFSPTVVADVDPGTRFFREELFGPAVGVTPVDDLDEAFELANRSEYGLGAGIFTRDVHAALRFAKEVEAGVLQVNWSPLWRADSMPYGGLKASGIGKEGPRWAVEELSEFKTVVFHPGPQE